MRLANKKVIDELEEIPVERNTKEDLHCTPAMHTRYRRLQGQINWLLSRTQFQCCYKFSRCASKAASPTIGDKKALDKLARQLKSQPVKLQFWPLTGPLTVIGCPDASYRNNQDGSSQRGMKVFLPESLERSSKDAMSYGSLIDYESQKIKKTVLSTTVAELYSFMTCFGSRQILRGLWMDISGEDANIHMRTDAKNLVTTARTIHLPEQKETILMISMFRKEACSGTIHDLAHIPTETCSADCLTKESAKADNLITVVKTWRLLDVDSHPYFRTLMECLPGVELFLNALRIPLTPTPREGPFYVMCLRNQHINE